jgi:hypothetical protein
MNRCHKSSFLVTVCLSLFLVITITNAQKSGQLRSINQAIEHTYFPCDFTKSKEGEFLIDTNIVYVTAPGHQEYPAIVFDGNNYFVVYQDWRSGNFPDIFGNRVNQAGVVLDSAGVGIAVHSSCQWSPAIAFDGSNYLIVWHDQRNGSNNSDIYCVRVSLSCVILDSSAIAVSTAPGNQYYPKVAFDGVNYLVVWEDYRNSSNWDIYGARINQDGVVLDPAGIHISDNNHWQRSPSVVFGDSNYFVAWRDSRNISTTDTDIFGARVDTSGVVLDPLGIAVCADSGDQYLPSLAFDGNNYLAVWQDGRNFDYWDVYGCRVDQSGQPLDSINIPICTANYNQYVPSVVFNGMNFFIVWMDERNLSGYDIYGARVDTNGTLLDSLGIPISTEVESQYDPVLQFDGTNHLVVWADPRNSLDYNIYGTRVDISGNVLDSTGFALSFSANYQYSPCVASNGSNYMIVWENYSTNLWWQSAINGALIDNQGSISNFVISDTQGLQAFPKIANGGINYLALWVDGRNGASTDIYGCRIDTMGVILDSLGIPISTANYNQYYPSAAFDGINYFTVWRDSRSGSADIYGSRLSLSGTVLDTSGLFLIPSAGPSSICFDGTNYLLVWVDRRNGNCDIYGARISTTGIVLDSGGFAISLAPGDQVQPAVTFGGQYFMVVWQDSRNDAWNVDIYGARVDTSGAVLDPSGIVISMAMNRQWSPTVAFDGLNYIVLWADDRWGGSFDIYGSYIYQSGYVSYAFVVSDQLGDQIAPSIAKGSDKFLVTYSSFTDSINNRPANTMRIWGKFYPFLGITDDKSPNHQITTFTLQVHPNPSRKECIIQYTLPHKSDINLSMYDVTGRLVEKIINEMQNPGLYQKLYDMSDLSHGVYFIRLSAENYSDTKKITLLK